MKTKVLLNVCVLALTVTFVACTDKELATPQATGAMNRMMGVEDDGFDDNQDSIYGLPLLSFAQLEALDTVDLLGCPILDYRVARTIAHMQLYELQHLLFGNNVPNINIGTSNPGWHNLNLTNRPVVVYDYDDTPYYYEFGVLYDDVLIKTITVAAKPTDKEIIEYIMEPIDYSVYNTIYNRYVGEYPNVYYGNSAVDLYKIAWDGSYVPLVETPDIISDGTQLYRELVDSIGADEMEKFELEFPDTIMTELFDVDNDGVADITPYVITTTEEYRDAIIASTKKKRGLFRDWFKNWLELLSRYDTLTATQYDIINYNLSRCKQPYTYFAPSYQFPYLRFTRWSGACGPSLLAWLYRGKYAYFSDVYLPIHGDGTGNRDNFIRGLNSSYYQYGSNTFGGNSPLYSDYYNRSQDLDGGLYYIPFGKTREKNGEYLLHPKDMKWAMKQITGYNYRLHNTLRPIDWIKDEGEPVVVLGRTYSHYFAAIGASFRKGAFNIRCNRYLLVVDNGYMTSDHGYYPFWRKKRDFDFYYGMGE